MHHQNTIRTQAKMKFLQYGRLLTPSLALDSRTETSQRHHPCVPAAPNPAAAEVYEHVNGKSKVSASSQKTGQ